MCKIRKDKSLEVPSVHTRTDAYAMQRKTTLYTVDENIIVTTKKRNNFCYPKNGNRNIGLFSFAPHLFIALSTLR